MLVRIKLAEVCRARKGWTMKQLASSLAVDHQTVLYWNQGRTYPRIPMLVKICQVLGCQLDELVEVPVVS